MRRLLGGACVWGKLFPAADSLRIGALPIGLANGLSLVRDVPAAQRLTWDDVRVDAADETYRYRRVMETFWPDAYQRLINSSPYRIFCIIMMFNFVAWGLLLTLPLESLSHLPVFRYGLLR